MKYITTNILFIFFSINGVLFGQIDSLPNEVIITDIYYSPWGADLKFKYKLDKRTEYYQITRILSKKNGKKKSKNKKIGKISNNLIKQLINIILTPKHKHINPSEFSNYFTEEIIKEFLDNKADNYWISTMKQREFIRDELIELSKLKQNLEAYYKNYDHSNWIDGPYSQIKISFNYNNKNYNIISKSNLQKALPIEINKVKFYSVKLADLLSEIIPNNEINRKKQLIGNDLSLEVIEDVINNKNNILRRIEVTKYQIHVDSLKKNFKVTKLRVINATYSTNWEGEKRIACSLVDTNQLYNISILYSTSIENSRIIYPVSEIIKKSDDLHNQLYKVNYLINYLRENQKRKIAIIFDDYNCFTKKVQNRILKSCNINTIDFNKSILLAVWDEYNNLSNWVVLPNNHFFLWQEITGETIKPINNKYFLNCRDK